MVKLCLMASQGYLPALVFNPEQSFCRAFKQDYQPHLPSPDSRNDIVNSCSHSMKINHYQEAWKPINRFLDNPHLIAMDSIIKMPVQRNEEFLKFLISKSSEVEKGGADESLLSNLLGLRTVTINVHQDPYGLDYVSNFHSVDSQPYLIYPSSDLYSQKPHSGLMENLACKPEFTFQLDSRTEMKDVLSVIAEFYLSKNSTTWRKQSMVVPYFDRMKSREAREFIRRSSLKLESATVAPLKSPGKTKLAPPQKNKTNRKTCKEKDVHKQNYLYACESLLSIIVDKNRNGKTAVLALKKSGPELPQLLTQFSASIAGTGLALLFSVVCKVGTGKAPFCASKLLNTGLGFGLVWLSWAVNRLRDTIVNVSKNSSKLGLKEEEIMKNLDASVKEIFFRAAALMAVVVLRLA